MTFHDIGCIPAIPQGFDDSEKDEIANRLLRVVPS